MKKLAWMAARSESVDLVGGLYVTTTQRWILQTTAPEDDTPCFLLTEEDVELALVEYVTSRAPGERGKRSRLVALTLSPGGTAARVVLAEASTEALLGGTVSAPEHDIPENNE